MTRDKEVLPSATRGTIQHVLTDERNFVKLLTDRLRDRQHPDPAFWTRYNGGPLPETLTSPDALLRRFHINRHWQSIIAMETPKYRDQPRFASDSITARYGLIDQADCDFDTWLSILNETLLPFIMRYEIGFPAH